MAAAHQHRQKHFLPPSPPPSPPATRRRRKHHDEKLAKLAATPLPSPTLSATFDQAEEEAPEPLWKKVLLTPILFTSFLLSLFLVNAQNRARRTAAHTPPSSYLTYLFPSSWLDPEPYQDHNDSTWSRRGAAGHVEPHDVLAPREGQLDGVGEGKGRGNKGESEREREKKGRRGWHLNKKIRKVARLEVSDAFETQSRVMVAMAAVVVVGLVGCWVGVRWVWRAMVG